MKIFGLEINWKRPIDDKVVVRAVKPSTTPVSKIPSTKIGTLSYAQEFSIGRGHFISSEYDLSEIGKIEDVDSYVRQSFKKKEGLMFKEGVGISGANKNTIRYYKARMGQIARATNIPTITLLKRISRSLIRTSNAFLIKVRDQRASGGKVRTTADGKKLRPIAGYFPAAPETMRVDIDSNTGKIRQWKQVLPGGLWRYYNVEDVIHFAIDKREGFLFGTPVVIPVIDDIRALRQIEENIELLLYQHLFPLFHYKVGTETAPAGYTETGEKEIDVIEEQIRTMPSEGALVTPERHEIKAIGAEGRALRAEGYLTHFKKRVFAGLGVSEVDMGDGQTANRATANVLSRALIDSVKAIQDDLEAQWDHEVISELLLESTFGDRVLEDENMVHLQFAEIDIQNKMEQEKHASEMFKSYGLTYDEYRAELAREPIPIPDNPEDQDPNKYPEWHSTYWKLFEEPLNLIRAVDEPYSVAAQAATEMRSLALTQRQQQISGKESERAAKQKASEDRKTKVAVARARPRATKKKDHFLSSAFKDLESDTAARLQAGIRARGIVDREYLLSLGRTWANDTADKFHSLAVTELIRGFNDHTGFKSSEAELLINLGRDILYNRISYLLNRLVENTVSLIKRRVDEEVGNVKLAGADAARELHIAFDAVRYRTDFIWDTEIRKAYAFGRVLGMRFLGEYGFQLVAHPDGCDRCQAADGRTIIAAGADIDDVPPLHPNSRMKFRVISEIPEPVAITDSHGLTEVPKKKEGSPAVAQTNPGLQRSTEVCPDCGNTATWQPRSGNFYCAKCKIAFQKDEEVHDATDKFERCVLKVKSQLRKKNPNWNEKRIKSSAYAICTAQLKKG